MVSRAPDGVRKLTEQAIRSLSDAVGCIDSSTHQTINEDMLDAFGHPLGQVSVRVIPNGHLARVDVLLHGVPAHVKILLMSMVLEELRGQQFKGVWQAHPLLCRFTVPKEMRLLLGAEAPARAAVPSVERTVCSLTLDYLEQIQERLEGGSERKGGSRR
ncbi:MAG: hypothetical protein Q7S29_05620 [Candidatus Peribacter sp.]|nr:hypothetical protein [Candidatus Peribacter sp.]